MDDQRNPYGFPETRTRLWDLAKESGNKSIPHARAAFGTLVEEYRAPIEAYLRGWAKNDEDWKDLVQGFLCNALEKDKFAQADRGKAVRLRWFLLRCLRNYVIDLNRREIAQKRDPGVPVMGLDAPLDSGRMRELEDRIESSEDGCNRKWRQEVKRLAMEQVEQSLLGKPDKLRIFRALRAHWEGRDTRTLRDIAKGLNVVDKTLRSHKTRFTDELEKRTRALVGDTVSSQSEEDHEIAFLRSNRPNELNGDAA